jgi:hypothetical protein
MFTLTSLPPRGKRPVRHATAERTTILTQICVFGRGLATQVTLMLK